MYWMGCFTKVPGRCYRAGASFGNFAKGRRRRAGPLLFAGPRIARTPSAGQGGRQATPTFCGAMITSPLPMPRAAREPALRARAFPGCDPRGRAASRAARAAGPGSQTAARDVSEHEPTRRIYSVYAKSSLTAERSIGQHEGADSFVGWGERVMPWKSFPIAGLPGRPARRFTVGRPVHLRSQSRLTPDREKVSARGGLDFSPLFPRTGWI